MGPAAHRLTGTQFQSSGQSKNIALPRVFFCDALCFLFSHALLNGSPLRQGCAGNSDSHLVGRPTQAEQLHTSTSGGESQGLTLGVSHCQHFQAIPGAMAMVPGSIRAL